MESTHDVRLGAESVTKRFVSNERGEADREWAALQLLQTYAPGLAPAPIGIRRHPSRPVIEMSRLAGRSLGGEPLTDAQLHGIASALKHVHTAVPATAVETLPPRISGAAEMVALLRQDAHDATTSTSTLVGRALAAGREWIDSTDADALTGTTTPVFARADGNIANLVWDGQTCRIVDFEDSGTGDLAYEVADLVEHVSCWLTGVMDAEPFLALLDLPGHERDRVQDARRVFALFWLIMLMPGGRGHERNPPGSVDRQADRLLSLLD